MSTRRKDGSHDLKAIMAIANELRSQIRDVTCCPGASAEVSKLLLATFVLDIHEGDATAAANELEAMAAQLVDNVRSGLLTMVPKAVVPTTAH